MKKLFKVLIPIIFFSIIVILNIRKIGTVYYIPFNIPGQQMAATVPPFGMFIEESYKDNKSILKHEKVHWKQYEEMGLFKFYYTYTNECMNYGRYSAPMEVEARKLEKIK